MSFFAGLYQLFIGPLALIFDVIYVIAYTLFHNAGFSIIFLSLSMNCLVLPLYRRADAMQAEERETELKLEKWTKHIKKTFSGDERFMMLQTYYRQNHYKPTYALKGSLSLLLEVPFFIAAYQFLSHLGALNGVSFWFIRDLGKPDALFSVGGFAVNVLPILMTVINIISGFIYTRGLSLKSKIQLYGMALIFLVFLYQSPAGLVFYWTLNNLFSLGKNIFYRLKDPKTALAWTLSVVGGVLLIVVLFIKPMPSITQELIFVVLLLLMQLPLILKKFRKPRQKKEPAPISKKEASYFRLSCVFLTVLLGLLIPSAVIASSPLEFVDFTAYRSPLWHVLSTFLMAAGMILVWLRIFYSLSGIKARRAMGWVAAVACVWGTINYMAFSSNLGNMSADLVFDSAPSHYLVNNLVNSFVLVGAAVLTAFIIHWNKDVIRILLLAGGIAIGAMSAMNVLQTNKVLAASANTASEVVNHEPGFTLSREGKNVVVIMMDRAIGPYVPFMMEEKPELKEQFAGFTFYSNTLSFGASTNFGTPGLYGGYEYTPEEMNARSDEYLVDKQNEALKVMPVLFLENGYQVSVCDPTYAGYKWVPDLSIYNDYPAIRRSITKGRFVYAVARGEVDATELLRRNLFCYSVFRASPVVLQPTLYGRGSYNSASLITAGAGSDSGNAMAEAMLFQERHGKSKAIGKNSEFIDAYTVLEYLPQITELQDGEQNCFVMMSNDVTHSPTLMQTPDYALSAVVDNTEYDAEHALRGDGNGNYAVLDDDLQMAHYHSNMAGLLMLGQWLDYLREEGVYDNTRIIIVSDHGRDLEQYGIYDVDGTKVDPLRFGALLMVKDFDSQEFTVDTAFHTNADTPYFATEDLIENAANPFSGKAFEVAQPGTEYHIIGSSEWNTQKNNGKTFLPSKWFGVHDEVYNPDCWRVIAEKR